MLLFVLTEHFFEAHAKVAVAIFHKAFKFFFKVVEIDLAPDSLTTTSHQCGRRKYSCCSD